MRKVFLALLLVAGVALAQTVNVTAGAKTSVNVPKPIKTIYMAGKGIAVNPNDLTDFMLLKAAAGKVKVGTRAKGLGVIHIDGQRYYLKNVQSGNGTIQADLYKSLSSETAAGNLNLQRIDKPKGEVWAGTLEFNSKDYYAYIIGFHVPITKQRMAEKAKEYCQEHPNETKCTQLQKIAKNRITEYCENHPNDVRCKGLEISYCARNIQDAACREKVREYCEDNPDAPVCKNASGVAVIAVPGNRAMRQSQERQCMGNCVTGCEGKTATQSFKCRMTCRRNCMVLKPTQAQNQESNQTVIGQNREQENNKTEANSSGKVNVTVGHEGFGFNGSGEFKVRA